MVYKKKKKKSSGVTIKNEIMQNKELGDKLYKPIFRKFEKQKVHSSFIDNIWVADIYIYIYIYIFL